MTRRRRLLIALFLAAFLGACAATPEVPGGRAGALPAPRSGPPSLAKNGDFEAPPAPGRPCPPSWWCTMHNDPKAFEFELATDPRRQGRFLKVTRVKPEPWALVTQGLRVSGVAGKRLRVTASVNTEHLEGGAGPMVILQGAGGRAMGDRKALQPRRPGWHPASVEMVVGPGVDTVEVALIMEGGGWVGFDDVHVEVLPPA